MGIFDTYLAKISTVRATGQATEHSYRASLEFLFTSVDDGISALNEPKRVKVGAPDFIIQRKQIVVGHAEAKDYGMDLRNFKDANKEQHQRYVKGLPNLIYTNCLDFDFYRNGELYGTASLDDPLKAKGKSGNFTTLENLLRDFVAQRPQTITSPKALAKIMAGKASLIKDVLFQSIKDDADQATELVHQFQAFRDRLIHDITPEDFADIYAETIAYGMFAARLHDDTPETFSRSEARELLPKSNPFLRDLFDFVAGPNLDDRLKWIVDDLADVFQASDMPKLMAGFGKFTGQQDPFLHFYETFLAEYNPAKRKARGVWYTPEPVVNFIVRAVDEVLQTEFGLADGLADTSKVTIDWETGQKDKKGKPEIIKKSVHRVQILDPATGTGTFLAEVIKQVAPRVKHVAEGHWSKYIEQDLIPRLHGFELLMASYAMCHMKLDMVLTELGYKPTDAPPRLSVYLTNSLEEGEPADQTLPFAHWLAKEAKQANTIKRDMPIMCVIGNPPYLGEGGSKKDWIGGLLDAYKKEPGGHEKLKERNPKWLNDLYVKFMRLSEHLIDKTGEGVLGFITNHGYLDNPTFRGMRWHLLNSFDKIYVLDLHGNSKKKEVSPDGSPDKNVFDIQQGVAIIIAVKKKAKDKSKKPLAQVFHAELWGARDKKYDALWDGGLKVEKWQKLKNASPQYRFVSSDNRLGGLYGLGFNLSELFVHQTMGVITKRDEFTIRFKADEIWASVVKFANTPDDRLHVDFDLPKDSDWVAARAKQDILTSGPVREKISKIRYAPFDDRFTYYTGQTRGFHARPVVQTMRHFKLGNFALSLTRKIDLVSGWTHVLAIDRMMTHHAVSQKEGNYLLPLYLIEDLDQSRRINFDPKLYSRLQTRATHKKHGTPDEVQVFDYIYGVLHCPAYRETYAEFLKIDFPRIPWPASPDEFWDVCAKGEQLRRLHLMEPEAVGKADHPFKGSGNSVVDKPRFEAGRVWINYDQYFENVPDVAWNFYIGGYQPAQKWLKDRKGRTLEFEDIKHYQSIIKILSETDRIMKTITLTLEAASAE